MGVGSSRVARSNSRRQQQQQKQPQPSQRKPEPVVVPVLTNTQASPPPLPTVVRSRTKYGIDEPEQHIVPPLASPPNPPQLKRSQSTRSPESAARITERHAKRMHRAYGSEDGQFFQQQRAMTVPAPQQLRNPLPLPPKDYISKSDFSRVYYNNPRPFVPVPAEDVIRSKTKGKGKMETVVGRDVFVARGDEPSSSFSSHSSASTSNPPQQVVTTPFGVLHGQQQNPQAITALLDPGHDKEKGKGGLFSSLFHSSRRHSRSTAHDPANATSLTRRPSTTTPSAAQRPISPPYMLAPRGAVQPPQPFFFYHPDAPGYGFTTFSPHKILYRQQLYPTAEHLYQCMKFMPSKGKGGDPAIVERIRTISDHPAQAVLEGRQLNKQARPDWKEMRTRWMDEIMYMKFAQHPNLRHELTNTYPAELIFASLQDPFWGVGPDGQGRNELGHCLGRVRTRILREMGR